MRDNLAVAFVLALLVTATSLLAVGLVAYTIKVHADADGFVTWHKVFYDAAPARYSCTPSGGGHLPVCHAAAVDAPASADPAPSRPVVNITDDPGGNVGVYYRKYAALNDAGAEVHFHGVCMSACTFVLFTEFTNIRACADPGSIFGFHKPFQMKPDGKTVLRTKSAVKDARDIWNLQLKSLPLGLRRYLSGVRVPSATDGDETNTLLILPGDILLPKCKVEVAAR